MYCGPSQLNDVTQAHPSKIAHIHHPPRLPLMHAPPPPPTQAPASHWHLIRSDTKLNKRSRSQPTLDRGGVRLPLRRKSTINNAARQSYLHHLTIGAPRPRQIKAPYPG